MRSSRVRAVLTLSLILLACSQHGDRAADVQDSGSKEYFPLVEGARWVYSLEGMVSGQLEVIARGTRPVRGLEAEVFIMDEVMSGSETGFADVAPVGYVRLDGYLGRLLGLDYGKGEIRLLGEEDPVRFMPLDPRDATEWEDQSRIFELPEGKGGTLRWTHRVSSVPRLEVAAGTFEDVLLVESQYWDDSLPDRPVLRFEDFYAKGVGLLLTITYDEQNEGKMTIEQELMEYAFPERSNPGESGGERQSTGRVTRDTRSVVAILCDNARRARGGRTC